MKTECKPWAKEERQFDGKETKRRWDRQSLSDARCVLSPGIQPKIICIDLSLKTTLNNHREASRHASYERSNFLKTHWAYDTILYCTITRCDVLSDGIFIRALIVIDWIHSFSIWLSVCCLYRIFNFHSNRVSIYAAFFTLQSEWPYSSSLPQPDCDPLSEDIHFLSLLFHSSSERIRGNFQGRVVKLLFDTSYREASVQLCRVGWDLRHNRSRHRVKPTRTPLIHSKSRKQRLQNNRHGESMSQNIEKPEFRVNNLEHTHSVWTFEKIPMMITVKLNEPRLKVRKQLYFLEISNKFPNS